MSLNFSSLKIINEKLGDDFDSIIINCNNYRNILQKNNNEIKNKIMSEVVGDQATLIKTLNKVQNTRQEIISIIKDVDQLKLKYSKFKQETESIRNVFQTLISDMNEKSNKVLYLICLKCIKSISNQIRSGLSNKQDDNVIKSYVCLSEINSCMVNLPCKNLVSYINKMSTYWYCIIKQFYSEDFDLILKQINWPFTINKSLDTTKHNLQRLASILIKIQLPGNEYKNRNEKNVIQLMEHFSRVSLPVSLLVVPFQKRFFFHFTGKKQTNKPDKPEWFLSRVLSWIRDYRSFLIDWLGPVYLENNKKTIEVQHEFIVGLLQPVVIKLDTDLSHFQLEDIVFSHIVDETLAFEHELRKVYNYPDDYPSVTEVLTQAHIFFKWINMERKYALIKMDTILTNSDVWKIIVNDNLYKITRCSDNILTLLNTMTDRYSILRQPRHKLQFLKLQTDLLNDFKEKIVDVYKVNESQNIIEELQQILCTLHYIAYVLNNWGTNMHFLSLFNYKCELENEVRSRSESEPYEIVENAETVFDDIIHSYNVEMDNLVQDLCNYVMMKIKRSAKNYKRDRWHVMSPINENIKYSITDSGWVMYETFAENLDLLSKNLPHSLFNKSWPKLAIKLSDYILNDILMANMFNKGGAQHLQCDVQYKMLPIISRYTTKPTIYVERLLEACKVLCFEPYFQPVILMPNEVSEILLRRIEHGNSIDLS